jgi:hypothetical protein
MIRTIRTIQKLGHRRNEIIGNSAADATIVELDHVFLTAAFDTAAFQNSAINAQIAKLIDNERDALSIGIFQQIADQRRLAGT